MGQIRLYRKIYRISVVVAPEGNTSNYTLIDPYALTTNSFVAGTGDTESNTLIESNTPVFQNSTGIYYTDLNPNLYATDVTYDLVWYITYLKDTPQKKLTTRFRLNNQTGPSGEISIEIISNTLEIEIL